MPRWLFVVLLIAALGVGNNAWAQPSGWKYKTAIRITNATATATIDFHQMLLIDTKSLVDAGQMDASLKDLRFGKDAKGVTLYPYFIESGANTASTKVWVKIDSVPANDVVIFYMFYGNNAAVNASTLNTFLGPFNTTDSTTEKQVGSPANNSQRGIWFRPKQNMLLTGLGKQMPVASTNTVTLFDLDTEDILEQTSVGGAAEQFNYTSLSNYRWLNKGADYVVELFVPSGLYYQANLQNVNKYMSIPRMVFCNGCDASTLPDPTSNSTSFAGFNGGYADMQFYVRNDSIDMPSYEFGPFIMVSPDTLKHPVYKIAFADTLTATDGIEPFTYEVYSGSLPKGFNLSTTGIITGTANDMGTYNFVVKVTDASAINGVPAFVTKKYTLTIDKAPQTITFNNLVDRVYGDTSMILSATATSGLPVTFSVAGGPIDIRNDTVVMIQGTGGALITARQAGNEYYLPVVFSQGFMINAQPLTLIADDKDKIYGDDNPALTVTYVGLVNGDSTVPGVVVTTSVVKNSDAGEYEIAVDADGNTNYELSYQAGKFTVKKRDIHFSLNAKPAISKVYDGTDTVILSKDNYMVTGIVLDDAIEVKRTIHYSDVNAGMAKTITADNIEVTGAKKDNYLLVDSSATVTGDILKRELNFTLSASPLITKVYNTNDTAVLAAANYHLDNVVSTDTLSVSCVTTYSDSKVANGKTITATNLVLNGTAKDNYTLLTTTTTTTGNITTQPVSVTLLSTPVIAKTYDGNDTAVIATGNYSMTGVIGNDNVVLNNPVYGSYDSKHAGENKKVTVNGLQLLGSDSANYKLTATSAFASIGTIVKKDVSVIADSASKVYGEEDSVLTYQITGLVAKESLNGALQREEGENVGKYVITMGSLANDDYKIINYTPAYFSITPKEIVVTADDKEREQGQKNPELTYTYTGFVRGEDSTVFTSPIQIATAAIPISPIGYYDIVPSGATAANYYFTFVNGKLTIVPASDKVRVWSSNRSTMQVRIFSERTQKVTIQMFTESGQRVLARQETIVDAINNFVIPVGHLPAAFYVVRVDAEDFMEAHKINIR
ncbi:fibronectin type III domain protein [Filimonas lacunae]|nr:fibronectin type III domain protein [Filimonas lacunae]